MSHVHAFPMHTYLIFNIFDIIDIAWDFSDCSSLFLPLNLFTLVVSMTPKRKSTPDPSLFLLLILLLLTSGSMMMMPKAFSENFSKHGIHLERQVILSDFADTDLPSVIDSRGWESLCDVPVTYPLVLIQEFYFNMHGIDRSVPLFSLAFEVM